MFSEKNVINAILNINYINNLAKKLTRFILASLIVMLAFISCEDASNILVTEKEAKTSNGRFELSLKIRDYDDLAKVVGKKIKSLDYFRKLSSKL